MVEERYDVVIVGGGPAGLTAGLFCGRAALRTLILEKGAIGGQLLATGLIDNYPGTREITGQELAKRMLAHASDFGIEIRQTTVTRMELQDREKTVHTEDGRVYRAGAVIICTGGSPRKLGVPGEAEFAGRGVSYCTECDAPFFKDRVIVVVGGGDSAVGEADYLTRFADKVYLISHKDRLDAIPILRNRLLANPKVEIIWNTAVEEIGGQRGVQWLRGRDVRNGHERRLEVGGVFIYIGFRPNNQLLRHSVVLDTAGYVVTNWDMETSTPGVFAAGDIRSQSTRQITNALGDATTAAIRAYRYLQNTGRLMRPEPIPIGVIASSAGRPRRLHRKAG